MCKPSAGGLYQAVLKHRLGSYVSNVSEGGASLEISSKLSPTDGSEHGMDFQQKTYFICLLQDFL